MTDIIEVADETHLFDPEIQLADYDFIIINSSGGKDSLCALYEVCRIASEQNFNKSKMIVSHQDLGDMEWDGTKELTIKQAELFGLNTIVTKRRNNVGYEENLLEYVERRGMWPSNKMRFCTSDFKRGPGARALTKFTASGKQKISVLYVFGFRKEESPSRAKKVSMEINKTHTTKNRTVYDWLPIHNWSTKRVWETIKSNNLPYHFAYDLGMPRLSCCFCIFSPFDALVVAGIANPKLLDRYVETEKKIGHTFRADFAIATVKEAIDNGYTPKKITDWVM